MRKRKTIRVQWVHMEFAGLLLAVILGMVASMML